MLATPSVANAERVATAVSSSCPAASTLHRAAKQTIQTEEEIVNTVHSERLAFIKMYLDEFQMNAAPPEEISALDSVRILTEAPFYIAVDGTYSSIANNQAAWCAVAFFVVSTITRISTPLLILARAAGTVDSANLPEQHRSESTTKALEKALIQEGIQLMHNAGIAGVPLVVADQDCAVQDVLAGFAWVVGCDRNHYFKNVTKHVYQLSKSITTLAAGKSRFLRKDVIEDIRKIMAAEAAPSHTLAASQAARDSSKADNASSARQAVAVEQTGAQQFHLGQSSAEKLHLVDKKVFAHFAQLEHISMSVLEAWGHVDSKGQPIVDPVRDAAKEHHARLELFNQLDVHQAETEHSASVAAVPPPTGLSVPPAKAAAFAMRKFTRNVHQAAKMAGGHAQRMRDLLGVVLLHYSGDHSRCAELYPRGCTPPAVVLALTSPYLVFLDDLFSTYFGNGETLSMGALCMTLGLSTNCCESFNSNFRTYIQKTNAHRLTWYSAPFMAFLDRAIGRGGWRAKAHSDLGSSQPESHRLVLDQLDNRTAASQADVRSNIDSIRKSTRRYKRRRRSDTLPGAGKQESYGKGGTPLPTLASSSAPSITQHAVDDRSVLLQTSGNLTGAIRAARLGAATTSLAPDLGRTTKPTKRARKASRVSAVPRKEAVRVNSDFDDDVSTENETDVLSTGSEEASTDSETGEESLAMHPLSRRQGIIHGWQAGAVRYVEMLDGANWYTAEAFVAKAWRQVYFRADTGDVDVDSDGEVAFTVAEPSTDAGDDDNKRPAGTLSIHSSTEKGYVAAKACTERDILGYCS
jgi:hypothetical protein